MRSTLLVLVSFSQITFTCFIYHCWNSYNQKILSAFMKYSKSILQLSLHGSSVSDRCRTKSHFFSFFLARVKRNGKYSKFYMQSPCVCVFFVCVCVCLFIFFSLESLMGRDVSVDLFFNEAISSCFYPVKYLVVFFIHCYF